MLAQITPGDSIVPPPGWSVWMAWDYNGDGVLDAVEQSPDSIKIHDGVSASVLGTYGPDGAFNPSLALPLSQGRIAITYSDPSGNVFFKIYSGFTVEEYVSPTHPNYPAVYAPGDADGDGKVDIVIYDISGDTTHLYSGAPPYGPVISYEGEMRLITPGNVLVFVQRSGNVSFKVYNNATNLVYTSSPYPFSITATVSPFMYDDDAYVEILLHTVGSSWTADYYVFSTNLLGISEREGDDRTALPGIVREGTLELDGSLLGATLKVMDVSGRVITVLKVRGRRVRLNLPAGVYFYALRTEDGVVSGKMVILK